MFPSHLRNLTFSQGVLHFMFYVFKAKEDFLIKRKSGEVLSDSHTFPVTATHPGTEVQQRWALQKKHVTFFF